MRRSGCTSGRTCCGTCASISGCASFASACQTPEPGGGGAAVFALAAAEVCQNRGQLLQLLHNTRSTVAVLAYLAEPSEQGYGTSALLCRSAGLLLCECCIVAEVIRCAHE